MGQMSPAGVLSERHIGTSFPYSRAASFATLFLVSNQRGASMFIFQRPLVAPLLALATIAALVALDILVDLSALF
jgi:hypothetical protein